MSFAIELEATSALATEYTTMLRTIQALSVAEDHDPRWSENDAARLGELERRHRELRARLTTELSRIASAHPEAWRGFLSESVDRLRVLAAHDEPPRIVSYERDQWANWLEGVTPDDPAEIFARGVRVLDEHHDLIEALRRRPAR